MSGIHNRIRARRIQLGITIEALADRMGYKDKSSISKIENGKADIPQAKIAAFAQALNTTTAYLMGIDESPEELDLTEKSLSAIGKEHTLEIMTIEEQLKNIILERYKSVRAFTLAFEIPYSTVDTMLKKGIKQSKVQNVLRIFDALGLDVESIQTEILSPKPYIRNKQPAYDEYVPKHDAIDTNSAYVTEISESGKRVSLKELIVSYRGVHGLSQRQFAERCGLSNGYISMLENGINPKTQQPIIPSLPVLKRIASGMELTLGDLLSQIKEMDNESVDMYAEIPNSLFYERLKNARKRLGLTQKAIATQIGITESAYCGYERGKRQPSLDMLSQLTNVLHCFADYLLNGTKDSIELDSSNTVSTRLKQIMDERNLRQSDILALAKPYCEQYGVKLGKSDLSQFINGKVIPGQWKLTVLALTLDVSESWLLGLNVPRDRIKLENIPGDRLEKKFVKLFRRLDAPERKLLLAEMNGIISEKESQK